MNRNKKIIYKLGEKKRKLFRRGQGDLWHTGSILYLDLGGIAQMLAWWLTVYLYFTYLSVYI